MRHFQLTEAEQKEAMFNPIRWIEDQAIATPVGRFAHTKRTQLFINTVQFAQESQLQTDDFYGAEVKFISLDQ